MIEWTGVIIFGIFLVIMFTQRAKFKKSFEKFRDKVRNAMNK